MRLDEIKGQYVEANVCSPVQDSLNILDNLRENEGEVAIDLTAIVEINDKESTHIFEEMTIAEATCVVKALLFISEYNGVFIQSIELNLLKPMNEAHAQELKTRELDETKVNEAVLNSIIKENVQ